MNNTTKIAMNLACNPDAHFSFEISLIGCHAISKYKFKKIVSLSCIVRLNGKTDQHSFFLFFSSD